MAEISYPFGADSAGGGSKMVSQLQWQNMAHLWGPDRIDFQLTQASYGGADLPFFASFSGSNLVVQPGTAWVGGFYYKLDAAWSTPAPTNTTSNPRIDLLVLRVDMSAGAVNLAVKAGQPAASPIAPAITRAPGGIWEMPLFGIQLAANDGTKTLLDYRRFDGPTTTYVPWSRSSVSQTLPPGNFTVDMDSNNNGALEEGFLGRDGDMVTRTLGKRKTYTPDLVQVSNKPFAGNRKGWWRQVCPGTVQFSIEIRNVTPLEITSSGGSTVMATTLPVAASADSLQHFTGFLHNPDINSGMPNAMQIVGRTTSASTTCYLWVPNWKNLSEGLDGLKTIPVNGTLSLNGVYETYTL